MKLLIRDGKDKSLVMKLFIAGKNNVMKIVDSIDWENDGTVHW